MERYASHVVFQGTVHAHRYLQTQASLCHNKHCQGGDATGHGEHHGAPLVFRPLPAFLGASQAKIRRWVVAACSD